MYQMPEIFYLPGQKRILLRKKIKLVFVVALVVAVIFTVLGYWWSYKVNIIPLQQKIGELKVLNEELKKGYAPPRR